MSQITDEETGSRPAPGQLALVQAFLNTVDLEGPDEQLATPEALAAWLSAHDLLEEGAPASEADLRLALGVREALRDLASANHDGRPDAEAAARLDALAAATRMRIRFGEDGPRLEPELPGVDGALGRLLAIVHASFLDGTWSRFKACRRGSCRWAFYDSSRNRGSSWCSMAVCGNREKARAYRERRRADA